MSPRLWQLVGPTLCSLRRWQGVFRLAQTALRRDQRARGAACGTLRVRRRRPARRISTHHPGCARRHAKLLLRSVGSYLCREVASPSPDLSPLSWSPGHPLQTRSREWQPGVSALPDVLLRLRRGRAAAQGAADRLWFGSRDLSVERHGFEFWCLCLFLGIFWPLLRAMARAAGMQERSMGRSLLQRGDCSGSCRPGALHFRGEDGRALAQGAKRRGERRGGGKKPWQLQSRLRHGVAFGTVVSLRDPGVASQSPFASRFQVPSRVSPHPHQF